LTKPPEPAAPAAIRGLADPWHVDATILDRLSEPVRVALNQLKDFLSERLYRGPATAEEVTRAQALLRALYDYHLARPGDLSDEFQTLLEQGEPAGRVVGDFLAGMTDRYAIHLAQRLFGHRYRVREGGFLE